jgi:hypothetical protein
LRKFVIVKECKYRIENYQTVFNFTIYCILFDPNPTVVTNAFGRHPDPPDRKIMGRQD